MNKKLSVRMFRKRSESGVPFVSVTAYDAVIAALAEESGIPMILVGDSLGMTVLGYETTLQVTLEDIIRHTAAVRRGAPNTFVIADMPFMTYQTSTRDAMLNAAHVIQTTGADAVKLEGGAALRDTIAALVNAGLPVLAHIGLLPQQVLAKGGYFLRGKDEADIQTLINDAQAVEQAGAFAVVVEGVTDTAGQRITDSIAIPTIGIAAGPHCDAQIQVINDLIGLSVKPAPKHAKHYVNVADPIRQALLQYRQSVLKQQEES